ncbi:CHRD domain-containing protein [Rhabdobacter roseus]|uniref:CHRD domain-containing protein n=1 Tax=Rhabdobacter roseus TaxID=1655419 RepID=A0A840TS18_9BACT|nr:CHRD domain-containing protein [Rhabdobacter roseus]MBB5285705.1 hypothetical protein [Rhabdobacter roseus]
MKTYVLVGIALVGLLMGGCKDKEEVSPEVKVMATLSGASEVPANTSTATGKAEGTFNNETKELKLTVTYQGITPVAWHIHKAAAGTNGSVLFDFGTAFSSPFNYSTTLTAEQEADLKAGLYYVNIHSATYRAGEIRGQLGVAP